MPARCFGSSDLPKRPTGRVHSTNGARRRRSPVGRLHLERAGRDVGEAGLPDQIADFAVAAEPHGLVLARRGGADGYHCVPEQAQHSRSRMQALIPRRSELVAGHRLASRRRCAETVTACGRPAAGAARLAWTSAGSAIGSSSPTLPVLAIRADPRDPRPRAADALRSGQAAPLGRGDACPPASTRRAALGGRSRLGPAARSEARRGASGARLNQRAPDHRSAPPAPAPVGPASRLAVRARPGRLRKVIARTST